MIQADSYYIIQFYKMIQADSYYINQMSDCKQKTHR